MRYILRIALKHGHDKHIVSNFLPSKPLTQQEKMSQVHETAPFCLFLVLAPQSSPSSAVSPRTKAQGSSVELGLSIYVPDVAWRRPGLDARYSSWLKQAYIRVG